MLGITSHCTYTNLCMEYDYVNNLQVVSYLINYSTAAGMFPHAWS